jgi:hypothetical protein
MLRKARAAGPIRPVDSGHHEKVINFSDDLMVTLSHKWLVHRAHEAVRGIVGQNYKSSVPIAQ